MKKVAEIWRKDALWILFLAAVIVLGILNLPVLYNALKAQYASRTLDTSVTEANFEDNFWHHADFIDAQGLIARLSGQNIDNEVVKGKDGFLHLMDDTEYVFNEDTESENVNDTKAILNAAEEVGADVLYVQRVYKTGELPYGFQFQQDRQYDFWGDRIANAGYPVLDIKKELGSDLEFYVTDHHWRVESAFEAAGCIIDRLNQEYDLELDMDVLDRDEYDSLLWEDSFLGSMGIRTGKYFAGKDDFVMLEPRFATNLTYRHYIGGTLEKEKTGAFSEAFVDTALLDDPNYNNKYNACLNGGYVENILLNHMNEGGKKALVISDSFARPMVQYLSLCFGETRYLDPQEGRYNDSYIEYIQEYKPDVVIIMYSAGYVER